jgi:hypothetical protein
MEADEISDEEFFRTLQDSNVRALLIGRRALVLLGAPVLTADYDLWLHHDDVELLNQAFEAKNHFPNRSAVEARQTGRYVIENGERIDVIVARGASTAEEGELTFGGMWERRQTVELLPGLFVQIPSIEDLIATKRLGSRPKDLVDIQWLETLRRKP